MNPPTLELDLLPLCLAVCRLPPGAAVPDWVWQSPGFASFTRTADELSLVLPEERVPAGWPTEGDWRCLKVVRPLDFALTGILAALAAPLAAAGVAIFALSTFDTDYVLVKQGQLATALAALTAAGHQVNVTRRDTR